MGRKKSIIIFPHLNDCKGNLSKDWYVEYQYQIPGEKDKRKERIYHGLNEGDEQCRRNAAKKIID
ncbi:MAG: hypothetical protein LBN95_12955 [Prevotellaceae bacterium]|jgi:hypothetical protein|nr:hypothetical protein [Prevotellaceae bacterium]